MVKVGGLGFVFDSYDQNDLLTVLRGAVAAFQRKEGWHKLMRRAMKADFSWKSSVSRYATLYQMAQRKVIGDGTND